MPIAKSEFKIISVLAGIFSLRMLGLAMLLPVFAVAARSYPYASPRLIGLAVGIYGLAQAGLQLPFGLLSDRYGRRPIIVLGLSLLLLGSLVCSSASTIYALILGRTLQGSAAIGSVVIACLLDNTEEKTRTLSMAILGISIGAAFVLALIFGPYVNQLFGMQGIFNFTALIAAFALVISYLAIPKNSNKLELVNIPAWSWNLLDINFGVFVLHASLAALFLRLPHRLQQLGFMNEQLWQLYAGVLFVALLLMFTVLKGKYLSSITGFIVSQVFILFASSKIAMILSLIVFFAAFCNLEAMLPSLIAKYSTKRNRGAHMGLYSTLQFLGVFIGGILGGWVLGVLLATIWLAMSVKINRLEQRLNYG